MKDFVPKHSPSGSIIFFLGSGDLAGWVTLPLQFQRIFHKIWAWGKSIFHKKKESNMKCPKCGMENTPDSKRCECGFNFFWGHADGQPAKEKKKEYKASGKVPIVGALVSFLLVVLLGALYGSLRAWVYSFFIWGGHILFYLAWAGVFGAVAAGVRIGKIRNSIYAAFLGIVGWIVANLSSGLLMKTMKLEIESPPFLYIAAILGIVMVLGLSAALTSGWFVFDEIHNCWYRLRWRFLLTSASFIYLRKILRGETTIEQIDSHLLQKEDGDLKTYTMFDVLESHPEAPFYLKVEWLVKKGDKVETKDCEEGELDRAATKSLLKNLGVEI